MIQNVCETTLLTTSSWESILATWLKSQFNIIDRNLIFWNWGNNNSVCWLFNWASNTISWFNIVVLQMQHPHWWKRMESGGSSSSVVVIPSPLPAKSPNFASIDPSRLDPMNHHPSSPRLFSWWQICLANEGTGEVSTNLMANWVTRPTKEDCSVSSDLPLHLLHEFGTPQVGLKSHELLICFATQREYIFTPSSARASSSRSLPEQRIGWVTWSLIAAFSLIETNFPDMSERRISTLESHVLLHREDGWWRVSKKLLLPGMKLGNWWIRFEIKKDTILTALMFVSAGVVSSHSSWSPM